MSSTSEIREVQSSKPNKSQLITSRSLSLSMPSAEKPKSVHYLFAEGEVSVYDQYIHTGKLKNILNVNKLNRFLSWPAPYKLKIASATNKTTDCSFRNSGYSHIRSAISELCFK